MSTNDDQSKATNRIHDLKTIFQLFPPQYKNDQIQRRILIKKKLHQTTGTTCAGKINKH